MYGETMVVPDSVKNLPEQVDKLLKMIKDSHDKMEFLEKEMFQIKNLEESILKRQKNKRQNLTEIKKKIVQANQVISDHKIPQKEEVNV